MVYLQQEVGIRKRESGEFTAKLLEKVKRLSSILYRIPPRKVLPLICMVFPILIDEAAYKCHPFKDLLLLHPLLK
jgi:hypothetical protein